MSRRGNRNPFVIIALILLAAPKLFSQVPNTASIRIAVLGSPVHQVAWTGDELEKLKAVGFNSVQLNIGWGYRPFDEPLNLVDVVTVAGEAELRGTGQTTRPTH